MTECTFFDDEQPPNDLPQWATITQVSDFLEIPRNAVRSAVRRAVENNEDWVKKEPCEGGSTHYLIDTTHEIYTSHEQRWRQNRIVREEYEAVSSADWSSTRGSFFSPVFPKEPFVPPGTFPSQLSWHDKGHVDDVLHHWTKFRQRLYSWGIQVFQNILAEEEQENPWQWRWGNLHGEGYPSEEEAIIAAIESQLMANEEEDEDQVSDDSAFFSQSTPMAQVKHQRFTIFKRRNASPPF